MLTLYEDIIKSDEVAEPGGIGSEFQMLLTGWRNEYKLVTMRSTEKNNKNQGGNISQMSNGKNWLRKRQIMRIPRLMTNYRLRAKIKVKRL